MIYNYVSSKFIFEKLFRDYDHQEDLDEADIIEWLAEALDFIGVAAVKDTIVDEREVVDHRTSIPCGTKDILAIIYKGERLRFSSSTLNVIDNTLDQDQFVAGREVNTENFPLLASTTDISSDSYGLNAGFIMTSFREGCITVVYKGVRVDEEGYPMVPDDTWFKEAVTLYCQERLDRRLWRAGKLPEGVYKDTVTRWEHFRLNARGRGNMFNEDKAESMRRQWTKLVPNINSWKSLFQDLNLPERRKRM